MYGAVSAPLSRYNEKNAAGSRRARLAAAKNGNNRRLWDLAAAAMAEVDPVFARRFTALAVTYDFRGSPHIDKQNIGPFYGLSLGEFPEGQGGIRVECTARQVAEVWGSLQRFLTPTQHAICCCFPHCRCCFLRCCYCCC